MKQSVFLCLLILAGAGLLCLPACKDPDPCEGRVLNIPKQLILEEISNYQDVFPVYDTVCELLAVRTKIKYKEYYWKLSTETNTIQDSILLVDFKEKGVGQVDIRFIGIRESDKLCFPNDDGIDTIDKAVYSVKPNDRPIWGRYQGSTDFNPGEIFTIELLVDSTQRFRAWSEPTILLHNLPNGCGFVIDFNIGSYGFQSFHETQYDISNSDACNRPRAYRGDLAPNGDIKIEFYMCDPSKTICDLKKITFTGKKL
jgi:hypothetical protein